MGSELSKKSSLLKLPCGRKVNPTAAGGAQRAQLEKWHILLDKYLLKQGLKRSEQRWKIAEIILSQTAHLSAQEIVGQVRRKHPEIGSATVYRNIKILCDASILKESLNNAAGRVVYETFDEDHHDHIICLDCNQIFEFHDDAMENFQNKATQKMNFKEVRHKHVIYAHCNFLAVR